MYSWGDDTSTWKKPKGYDYGSARGDYLKTLKKAAGDDERSYEAKSGPTLNLVDPKGKKITTQSQNPVIIGIDGTGSMQKAPAEIFDRLPLLYQTLSKYRPDIELSFSVIGDANIDKWPVQTTQFGKETVLDSYLKALCAEGGGGPGIRESYELWAFNLLEHAEIPKATSPFLIIMGDEKFYEQVDPKQAKKYLDLGLQSPVESMEVWKKLGQRFSIYLLQRPYAGGPTDEIRAQWTHAIGEQHVIPVLDDLRFVDVAMGLIAKQWGAISDFAENLSARQDEKSIEAVMESLRAAPDIDPSLKSKLVKKGGSKKSIPLTEE